MNEIEWANLQEALVKVFWPIIGWLLSFGLGTSIAAGIAIAVFEVGQQLNRSGES